MSSRTQRRKAQHSNSAPTIGGHLSSAWNPRLGRAVERLSGHSLQSVGVCTTKRAVVSGEETYISTSDKINKFVGRNPAASVAQAECELAEMTDGNVSAALKTIEDALQSLRSSATMAVNESAVIEVARKIEQAKKLPPVEAAGVINREAARLERIAKGKKNLLNLQDKAKSELEVLSREQEETKPTPDASKVSALKNKLEKAKKDAGLSDKDKDKAAPVFGFGGKNEIDPLEQATKRCLKAIDYFRKTGNEKQATFEKDHGRACSGLRAVNPPQMTASGCDVIKPYCTNKHVKDAKCDKCGFS